MTTDVAERTTALMRTRAHEVMLRAAWPVAFVVVAAMAFSYLRVRPQLVPSIVTVSHEGPSVVQELRALARLETMSLRIEKVIEVEDHQERLSGLIEANDRVLFVASGEVILGVDLGNLTEDDVRFDETTKTAHLRLPPPEILSSRFDEIHSYVHSRSTDFLAKRNEGLESVARKQALASFESAAREREPMQRAREQAERAIRALGNGWGAKRIDITWKEPAGEMGISNHSP